jgi:glycerol-3-phosphate dehydrogenase
LSGAGSEEEMDTRQSLVNELRSHGRFDVLIVGGGATGLGTAVEAASRGLSTVLVERKDFCHATSSRSTKLVHGGVRYLEQGDVLLVREALCERGRLLHNAPGVCSRLPLIVPVYGSWQKLYYAAGLKIYDFMAGRLSLGRTRLLSAEEVKSRIPTVDSRRLQGGILFYDGQFDDARLGIMLVRKAREMGALPVNYIELTRLMETGGRISGAQVRDTLSRDEFTIEADVLVNAAGTGADEIRRMADRQVRRRMVLSRGSHVVLSADWLGGGTALLVPKTDDGRVLFAIPWCGRTLAGTTEVPVEENDEEPVASNQEIDFILSHLNRYLSRKTRREDVLSVFAGLRPLVRRGNPRGGRTAALSRSHVIEVLRGNVVSIMGGKWTTYRKMSEDTVDRVIAIGGFKARPSATSDLRLEGSGKEEISPCGIHGRFSSDRQSLDDADSAGPDQPLHPALPYTKAEIAWAALHEWAWNLEDVLARRTRCLFLDAKASMEAAPEAARVMAEALGRDSTWQNRQVEQYRALARKYLPG